jgi:hypothetical protein
VSEPILTAKNVENTDVKALAQPEEPKPLSRQEIGKMRRHYTTVVHGTVKVCGHKFDPKRTPRHSHCESCWEAYFMTAVDTAAIHDDLVKGGKARLVAVYGKAFVRQFGKFLTSQLAKEPDGQDNSLLPSGEGQETPVSSS